MTTLQITGMTCENCVKHVTAALSAVPGAERVKVDLATGTAEVEGPATAADLAAAVAEEGYSAEPA